jgi:hypothetical protein
MPEADERLSVARQWVQKAENDLKNAAYTLQMGRIALQTPYASMLSGAPRST